MAEMRWTVKNFPTRDDMGKAAAEELGTLIAELLKTQDKVNMIFAAAPSQLDFLKCFVADSRVDFSRIRAFHMDEYIGLAPDAPQCFSNFLKRGIFDLKPFKSVNLINAGAKDAQAEADRYAKLLKENPVDIVCMGIGENGHIAFNDPHVADFNDKEVVKIVELDEVCRMQQVNDGCFEKLDDVPKCALTLTIPTLVSCKYNFCVVPASTKAEAVKNTVLGEISEKCPASILRTKDNAVLYCDADSSVYIKEV